MQEAPSSSSDSAAENEQDEELQSDMKWVEHVNGIPAAKPLIQHLAALEVVVSSGGYAFIEPPCEQVQTWRRIICSKFAKDGHAFEARSPEGKMPKCMAMCNLSGHHVFYHSENFSLARVLALSAQPAEKYICDAVNKVIAKAKELEASVLVCLCMPFQFGMERVYWDMRTIRIAKSGVVKDGEMAFCSMDMQPRTMPCSCTMEHWGDELLAELCKASSRVVSSLCLDPVLTEELTELSIDQMKRAIVILKAERRRLIDDHRAALAAANQQAKQEKLKADAMVAMADANADVRVSKVVASAESKEKNYMQKEKENNERFTNALSECAAQKTIVQECIAKMEGMKLENEQQVKAAKARQSTLEAQVKTLSSTNAKAIADASKSYKDLEKRKDSIIETQRKRIVDVEKTLSTTKNASMAVQASMTEMKNNTLTLRKHMSQETAQKNAYRALLMLASLRHSAFLRDQKEIVNSAEERVRTETVERCEAKRSADVACIRASLAEHEEKAGAKIAALEEENRKLVADAADAHRQTQQLAVPQPGPPSNGKRVSRHTGTPHGESHSGNGTINVSQNTAVYMGHLPHTSAFPNNGHYKMDPSLEASISQLHTALNALTAMARSSSSNQKALEMANAKLDVLAQFGIGTYDHCVPNVPITHAHNMHHQNGYFSGYWCSSPPSLTSPMY